jgi:hypothetical protein
MSKQPTQAQRLQEAVTAAQVELFHDSQHRGYASFPLKGHLETWPLRSADFRRYLALAYYKEHGTPVRREVVAEQLEVLSAQALFQGPEEVVHVRLAPTDGGLVLDLGGPDWSVIVIDADGWRWQPATGARLIRPPGILPLPTPEYGGSLDALRPFLNIGADDDQWRLLIGFLVGCYHPTGPYPVLGLHGEQGSAKSTVARVIRSLIDPRDALDRTAPRDERDLAVHAARNAVIVLDNLSQLPEWLSDALARLATGAGFSTRQLYTDDEEITLHARRPIVVNGIGSIVTRSDLLDRSLIVNLEPIPSNRRREEAEFWAAFAEAQALILGALLDAVSSALRRRPEVLLDSLPRMADFARWVTAAEPRLGWPAGAFLRSYYLNRGTAHELAIEADLVGVAVSDLMRTTDEWEGTPSALLQRLSELITEAQAKEREWPKAAHTLSNRLQRMAPNLRAIGIEVSSGTSHHPRTVKLRREASPASPEHETGDARDARDAGLHPLPVASSVEADGVEESEDELLAQVPRQ